MVPDHSGNKHECSGYHLHLLETKDQIGWKEALRGRGGRITNKIVGASSKKDEEENGQKNREREREKKKFAEQEKTMQVLFKPALLPQP